MSGASHRPRVIHTARILVQLLACVCLLVGRRADAVTQVSAALIIAPDVGQSPPTSVLTSGETVHISILLKNTSTLGTANTPAAVNLFKTTTVFLGCTDSSCAVELGALTFDSCALTTGVVSCVPSGTDSNQILITYAAGGKNVAANALATIVTITAHATPGQQVTSPVSGQFLVTGATGSQNIHLAASDGVRGQAGGSAPLYYPGACPDGVVESNLGFCCSLPATNGTCDKRFPCGADSDCQSGLCCDNSGHCNTTEECSTNTNCVDPGFPTCQHPPGTSCLLEQCDDGNNIDTDSCNNLCQPNSP